MLDLWLMMATLKGEVLLEEAPFSWRSSRRIGMEGS
jgi:hypothetical protein